MNKICAMSLVIPCFNEEDTVRAFYDAVVLVLSSISTDGENRFVEFVFVDDGSTDNTLGILRDIAKKDNRVRYISFSRNFGKEAALLAGLKAARGEYVTTLDADLQDPPTLIPQMLEAVAKNGFDCAGCRRVNRIGEPPIRSFFARSFYLLMKRISDVEILDGVRDFRLMSRQYVDAILSLPERSRFSKGIFPWIGFKTKWFEYENVKRTAGATKWSFWKLLMYSFDGIIAFSTKPLAIASVMGIFLFLVSIAFTGVIVIRRLVFGDPVAGWASIVSIILFCSGMQLFTTGIIGHYLTKTYLEVKQRPHYLIREEW